MSFVIGFLVSMATIALVGGFAAGLAAWLTYWRPVHGSRLTLRGIYLAKWERGRD